MKAIIDSKLYDTEKAEKLFSFSRRVDEGPLFWNEKIHYMPWHDISVYKTKKGNYFEADETSGKITTVTVSDVMCTIRRLNPDRYMQLYGEVEEG